MDGFLFIFRNKNHLWKKKPNTTHAMFIYSTSVQLWWYLYYYQRTLFIMTCTLCGGDRWSAMDSLAVSVHQKIPKNAHNLA